MSSMYKQSDLILRLSDPLMRQGHYLWTNKTMECCMQHGIWNLFIQFCPKITKRKTSRMQNARLKVFCRAHQICPYSFGCHKKILSSLGGSSSTTTCGCCSSKYPRIRPDGLHWWQRKNFRMQWLNDFRKLVYHKSIWILNHWQQKIEHLRVETQDKDATKGSPTQTSASNQGDETSRGRWWAQL